MKTSHREHFVTDTKGRKVAVLLNLEAYEQLLEDLHDLQTAVKRKRDQRLSLKELKALLKQNGR